jgi:hypothetical protein
MEPGANAPGFLLPPYRQCLNWPFRAGHSAAGRKASKTGQKRPK